MRRIVFVVLVSSLLVALTFVQNGNIQAVKASSSIYQGDLILKGNNVTAIENKRFDINGSIIVEENATLILRNTLLNFTQTQNGEHNMTFRNPLNGNPRLLVENATITASDYYLTVYLQDNSTSTVLELDAPNLIQFGLYGTSNASISDSTVRSLYSYDSATVNLSNTRIVANLWGSGSSTMTASNCTIGWLLAQQFCSVNVSDSSIGTAESEAYSVNCSIIMLKPGFFNYWNYRDNCSIKVSLEGNAPDVALSECQIERWSFEFQGASNISISDSLLYHLFLRHLSVAAASDSIFTSIYTHDSSINRLVNSTATHYYHYGESCTNVYWYLDVHVVDSIGQDVPSANVTATCSSIPWIMIMIGSMTDTKGWVRLTLAEMMMNATGEYPVGNYIVEAAYDIHSDATTVNMTENQQITLTLEGFVIPEFPSLLILPLFMIATLLAVILYRRKHSM